MTTTRITNWRVYLSCMLCREVGIIQYPSKLHFRITGDDGPLVSKYLALTVCSNCGDETKNANAMVYYTKHGVNIDYVKSTHIYNQINRFTGSFPVIFTEDNRAILMPVWHLVEQVTTKCKLYSMKLDDGMLFEGPPESSFFGITCT